LIHLLANSSGRKKKKKKKKKKRKKKKKKRKKTREKKRWPTLGFRRAWNGPCKEQGPRDRFGRDLNEAKHKIRRQVVGVASRLVRTWAVVRV